MNQRSKIIVWILSLSFLVIMLVAVLFFPVMQFVKEWRAEEMLQESQALSIQGNNTLAFQKAMSAHYLDPEEPAFLLQLAKTSVVVGHPGMNAWWDQATQLQELDPQELKTYISHLIETDAIEQARKHISQLRRMLPDDPEVAGMALTLLQRQRQHWETVQLAQSLIDAGIENPEIHLAKILALLSLPKPEYHEAAFRHLVEISDRPDAVGLAALRLGINRNMLLKNELEQATANLRAHPLAENADRRSAIMRQISEGFSEYNTNRSELLRLFDMSHPADGRELIRWLQSVDMHGEIEVLMKSDLAAIAPELAGEYMKTLLEAGEANKVYEMTLQQGSNNPLSRSENLIIRAGALTMLERPDEASEVLKLATQVADLTEFAMVERELQGLQRWDLLDGLYRRLLENDFSADIGRQKLLVNAYQMGDQDTVWDMLQQVNAVTLKSNPPLRNFHAYLSLLLDYEYLQTRQSIEALVAEFPKVMDFRLSLAMVYLQMQQKETALSLLENIPQSDGNSPRYFLVIVAAVHAANNLQEEAESIAGILKTLNLLPAERALLHRSGLEVQI